MREMKEEKKKTNFFMEKIYRFLGKWLAKHPILVLLLTLILAFAFTWLGLEQNGFPQFGDPYLGFQTRFTPISNKLTTLENFRHELNRLKIIENYPGEKITEKEWRRRKRGLIDDEDDDDKINPNSCTAFPLENYARIALKLDSTKILSKDTLSLICYFQKLVEEIPSYSNLCEIDDEKNCCPVWSLANYIALWSNKTDCADIQSQDVIDFEKSLNFCVALHTNETMVEECAFQRSSCPKMCRNGEILHSTLLNTIDKSYMKEKEAKLSMIIVPVAKSSIMSYEMEDFQNSIQSIQMPSHHITLAGFDFGGKDSLFKSFLIWDLQYVFLASVLIFIVVCLYTMSVFVSMISFGALVLSLGVSYYFYSSVFYIPYFPFMNMLVAIIVLGIGTDGTLILSVSWDRCKEDNGSTESTKYSILYFVLKETTPTLFITTCTTAAAFFSSSLTSSITTIKCFSIFAGTSILISFLLLYICVPTALVISDWFWCYIRSLIPPELEDNKFISKLIKLYKKIGRMEETCLHSIPEKLEMRMGILSARTLKIFSFLIFLSILIWSSFVVFHFPKFQLPKSEQFQLLTDSHPVEKFDREVEPQFVPESTISGQKEDLMSIYLIWGLKDEDNGFGLDPEDTGNLEFDPDFSLATPENQKWMRKLCKKIQRQSFYDQVSNSMTGVNLDSCFMDTMVSWMKRECEQFQVNTTMRPCCKSSKFPYEESVFLKCVGLAARDVYRTPSFYFRGDLAGPKFFQMKNEINATGSKLATFTVRIKTNVAFTLVHEKMEKFYGDVEKFFKDVMRNAPPGLQNGFFVSAHLDFYDLQKSLSEDTWNSVLLSIGFCFVLIWISSFDLTVAIGAAFVIMSTVIVSSSILIQLFDWKLGVFESIALTVAVGLSDFTAHHSLEFSRSKSVNNMMSPTFFSAMCTVLMGLFMMAFSTVLVYQQIGAFFFVLVTTSWVYSVYFLSPILNALEFLICKAKTVFEIIPCLPCKFSSGKSIVDDESDSGSNCELNTEVPTSFDAVGVNPNSNILERKQSLIERWKLLKKVTQETSV